MYSSLDRVDIVAEKDEGRLYVQTDHRGHDEVAAQLDLSIAFALIRVLLAREVASEHGPTFEVRYSSVEVPPPALQQAVASAGGTLEAAEQMLIIAADGADPYALFDGAMARLAAAAVEREGLRLDEAGLAWFEREYYAHNPDPEDDETTYWTLRVELAAVAAEVLRGAVGGRWVKDEHDMSMFPFAFGNTDGRVFNVFGRVERLFEEGVEQGPHCLVQGMHDDELPSNGTMISIKPAAFVHTANVVCRPLLDMPDADELDVDIPVIVYGEDRPNTFAHFIRDGDREQNMESYHREAMALLREVEVDVHEIEVAGMALHVVTGHYYAAEKLLDPDFMLQMHDHLDAELILASIPRKGVLFLTNGTTEDTAIFYQVTKMKHEEREPGEPISTTPFIVQDGRVVGLARVVPTLH